MERIVKRFDVDGESVSRLEEYLLNDEKTFISGVETIMPPLVSIDKLVTNFDGNVISQYSIRDGNQSSTLNVFGYNTTDVENYVQTIEKTIGQKLTPFNEDEPFVRDG